MVKSPATAGVVTYDWQAGDTDTPGEYVVEWHVTASGKRWTVPSADPVTLTIRPQLAGIVVPP